MPGIVGRNCERIGGIGRQRSIYDYPSQEFMSLIFDDQPSNKQDEHPRLVNIAEHILENKKRDKMLDFAPLP